MRAVTTKAIACFNDNKPLGSGNTTVTVEGNTTKLILFGNVIAIKVGKQVSITNCGWFSATTKERLNGLNGVHINQSKGVWYLNGKEWDGKLIKV